MKNATKSGKYFWLLPFYKFRKAKIGLLKSCHINILTPMEEQARGLLLELVLYPMQARQAEEDIKRDEVEP